MLINKIEFICPRCKKELYFKHNLYCPVCSENYIVKNGKYYFVYTDDNTLDKLNRIKNYFKKFHRFYDFLVKIISPVYIPMQLKQFLKKELGNDAKLALNLGSGNSKISKKIINIDLFDYSNVDIVCDISKLPIKSKSIDIIISIAVLEHVKEPEKIIQEILRVLKPKGKIFIYIPFIQGYHASPHDYQRYTISGMEYLFRAFEIIEVKCGSGPTSGLLWIFQEWLAMMLSFGLKPLYQIFHLILIGITFPIKFLDIFLIHHPFAKNIASGFTITASKK